MERRPARAARKGARRRGEPPLAPVADKVIDVIEEEVPAVEGRTDEVTEEPA